MPATMIAVAASPNAQRKKPGTPGETPDNIQVDTSTGNIQINTSNDKIQTGQ